MIDCLLSVPALSGPSLPSSSNSSAGPSSPTTASTPVDFLNKVKLYIIDSAKNDQIDHSVDSEQNLASANQNFCGILTQPIKSSVPVRQTSDHTSETGEAGSESQGKLTGSTPLLPLAGAVHQSAFKVVNRTGNQKLSFKVSQVSEDSLRATKLPEKDQQTKPPE